MQLYSNKIETTKSTLTRGVIFLLCNLKGFKITTGNKDHSTIMRKEFNKDEPLRIKS